MTGAATRVWKGIEASEPPVLRDDKAALLRTAEDMLATRRGDEWFDQAKAAIGEKAAKLEVAAFEYLVQNWRFIATGEGEPAGYGADHVLRHALEDAIDRITDYANEVGGISKTLEAKAQAVIGLRWHLEPGRDPIALARLNHQLRADARAANTSRKATS